MLEDEQIIKQLHMIVKIPNFSSETAHYPGKKSVVIGIYYDGHPDGFAPDIYANGKNLSDKGYVSIDFRLAARVSNTPIKVSATVLIKDLTGAAKFPLVFCNSTEHARTLSEDPDKFLFRKYISRETLLESSKELLPHDCLKLAIQTTLIKDRRFIALRDFDLAAQEIDEASEGKRFALYLDSSVGKFLTKHSSVFCDMCVFEMLEGNHLKLPVEELKTLRNVYLLLLDVELYVDDFDDVRDMCILADKYNFSSAVNKCKQLTLRYVEFIFKYLQKKPSDTGMNQKLTDFGKDNFLRWIFTNSTVDEKLWICEQLLRGFKFTPLNKVNGKYIIYRESRADRKANNEEKTGNKEQIQYEGKAGNEEKSGNEEEAQSEEKTGNKMKAKFEKKAFNREKAECDEKVDNEEKAQNKKKTGNEEKAEYEEISGNQVKAQNEKKTSNKEQAEFEVKAGNREKVSNEEQALNEEEDEKIESYINDPVTEDEMNKEHASIRIKIPKFSCEKSHCPTKKSLMLCLQMSDIFNEGSLTIYANGKHINDKGFVSVVFESLGSVANTFTRLTGFVAVVDASGERRFQQSFCISNKEIWRGLFGKLVQFPFEKYISRKILLNDPLELIPEDCLTLTIEVVIERDDTQICTLFYNRLFNSAIGTDEIDAHFQLFRHSRAVNTLCRNSAVFSAMWNRCISGLYLNFSYDEQKYLRNIYILCHDKVLHIDEPDELRGTCILANKYGFVTVVDTCRQLIECSFRFVENAIENTPSVKKMRRTLAVFTKDHELQEILHNSSKMEVTIEKVFKDDFLQNLLKKFPDMDPELIDLDEESEELEEELEEFEEESGELKEKHEKLKKPHEIYQNVLQTIETLMKGDDLLEVVNGFMKLLQTYAELTKDDVLQELHESYRKIYQSLPDCALDELQGFQKMIQTTSSEPTKDEHWSQNILRTVVEFMNGLKCQNIRNSSQTISQPELTEDDYMQKCVEYFRQWKKFEARWKCEQALRGYNFTKKKETEIQANDRCEFDFYL